MVSTEERMRILGMLSEGQISPDQAAQLLQALDADNAPSAPAPVEPPAPTTPEIVESPNAQFQPLGNGKSPRWLRVRVSDTDSGRPRVNIRVPISLVNFGLKMGRQFSPEIEGLDFEELVRALQSSEQGTFIDVFDENDGEHVEVFLE